MTDTILEPPGSIAIIGAGPLGIEAALYGRFLGYNVSLIEAVGVGSSLADHRDEPLPMLPDRCLSPLALGALNAQRAEAPPMILPTTVAEWIDKALVPLTETDLLSGRLVCPAKVTRISHAEIAPDDNEADEEVPPDFQLNLADGDPMVVEAIVLATGQSASIEIAFDQPADYLFRIGAESTGDSEIDLWKGLKEIVSLYASLAGRESLDLYTRKLPPPTQ